jgi:hypothetical protein
MVTINFGDLSIKGFRIRESEYIGDHGEPLWITPPSYKSMKGYRPIVYIQKDVWKKIEVLIIAEYKRIFQDYVDKKMKGVKVAESVEDDAGVEF